VSNAPLPTLNRLTISGKMPGSKAINRTKFSFDWPTLAMQRERTTQARSDTGAAAFAPGPAGQHRDEATRVNRYRCARRRCKVTTPAEGTSSGVSVGSNGSRPLVTRFVPALERWTPGQGRIPSHHHRDWRTGPEERWPVAGGPDLENKSVCRPGSVPRLRGSTEC
jgi:hypothetical protein